MTANKPRRLRPVLFLGIVWSIGGAFLLVESLSGRLLDLVLSSRTRDMAVAIPRQSRSARLHCEQVLKNVPRKSLRPQELAQSKYGASRLGQQLGNAAALVSSEIALPEVVANGLKSSDRLANQLGVPELKVPERGRAAYAVRNFAVYLQEDPQCTAAAFEVLYSSQHAALFKFGAAVAMAAFYRQVPEIGDVFGAEIITFGSAASLPSSLWRPLLEPQISVPAGSDLKQTIAGIVARIDEGVRAL
jgi:hypothetical protein